MKADLICPQLLVWRQIYAALEDAHRQAAVPGMPSPPPVYNMQGWAESSDDHKRLRWAATQAWAAENGFAHLIPDLAPDEYYDGD